MTTVPVSTIHSRANARVRDIRALRSHKRREETGLFFADGLHICLLAGRTGTPIEQIVVSRAGLRDPRAWEFLAVQEAAGVPILDIAPDVFATLCQKESSQPIGIVLRQRLCSLNDLAPPETPMRCYIALEGVQYPGNLGTVLRTADAVGCGGVILLDNATDPYDPASVRASLGAVLTQRIVRASSPAFLDWARRERLPLVGASPSAPQDYRDADYPLPLVLLMGRERGGLSPHLEEACTATVRIPMVGHCDSLNLAISTSVLLYGIYGRHSPALSLPASASRCT